MGAAYLERRIPHILKSMPGERVSDWQFNFRIWHLALGFLDEYYEEIFSERPNNEIWTDADFLFWLGTVFRNTGFTAHPRYLEVAELLGLTDVWEARGAPDFCTKIDRRWVCE